MLVKIVKQVAMRTGRGTDSARDSSGVSTWGQSVTTAMMERSEVSRQDERCVFLEADAEGAASRAGAPGCDR